VYDAGIHGKSSHAVPVHHAGAHALPGLSAKDIAALRIIKIDQVLIQIKSEISDSVRVRGAAG
jgi:hypothetical protein